MKQSAQQENKKTAQVPTSEPNGNPRDSISERVSAIRAGAKQGAACDAGFGN